jgi:anaerobic dimethyl sulfoxide reductase subunit A
MGEVRIVHTTGVNNCGGRCVIDAHVRDGEIIKITTDNPRVQGSTVPLSACARGVNYHKTFLGEGRLKYPMKRVGERGEGRFERISWEEAVETITREWIRIRDTFGPGSRYVNYSTGVISLIRPDHLAKRLLALDGGYLDYYNSYSTACVRYATPYMYGTNLTGNGFEDWLNSKLIILWGHNPAETVFDSGTMHYLRQARAKGIPIIGVDPRKNDTIQRLDAEWIPLKPTTDSALMDAMAYVIMSENLLDRDFIDRCCLGFDKGHMPEGVEPEQCYFSYLDGEQDGIPKTPAWASAICGVTEETIIRLARLYATTKPAALIQGYGPQRHGNGEQATRGGIMLACLTGNVGVSGGWACGPGGYERHKIPEFPKGQNPYPAAIPSFLWTAAIERGSELTRLDGITGGDGLDSDVKMVLNLAGNTLVNQHGDINRTIGILKDTSKCEFIVCSDLFMTASAKFADILLPGTSMFEGENISMPWISGDFLAFNNKAIEPLHESRFEYEWLREVAENLGIREAFTGGRETVGEWLEHLYSELREEESELPDYETFKRDGFYRYRNNPPVIAFEKECSDPQRHPFATPSGRIEIFSKKIYESLYREYVAPVPRYVPSFEGPEDPLTGEYPLQLIGWHTKRRCHSTHDSNLKMHKLDPQALWMNGKDAEERGIADDAMVRIWNDRGTVHLKVKITDRIMKGVVAVSEGAWYRPDSSGNDTGGSVNVLTSHKPTPFAKGNAQHTSLVQVEPL